MIVALRATWQPWQTCRVVSDAEVAEAISAQSLQRAYRQRSDCASHVPEHACESNELERHVARRSLPQRSVLRPMRCGFGAIGWSNPATQLTGEPCLIRAPGPN